MGFGPDLRYALRILNRGRLVHLVAVLSLGLGIGGTTAAVSLLDSLLWNPVPGVLDSARVVAVAGVHARDPIHRRMLSYADFGDYARQSTTLRLLSAYADFDATLTHPGPARRVQVQAVSGTFFESLGLVPARGRLLAPTDEASPVAILSYSLWRRLGGRSTESLVGTDLAINGQIVTVVGVAPQDFAGIDLSAQVGIWVPLGLYSRMAAGALAPLTGRLDRSQEWLHAVGRLAPGVSLRQARAQLQVEADRLAAAWPTTDRERSIALLPLAEAALGPGTQAPARIESFAARLFAVAAVVLGVACLNVAGLLLIRSVAHQREIAVRRSLGAGPRHVIRHLLAQVFVLVALGSLVGLAVASISLPLLARLTLPAEVHPRHLALSERPLAGLLLSAALACLLIVFAPAVEMVRRPLAPMLRGASPPGLPRRFGLQDLLVGLQIAAAFLVLATAGLLLQSLGNLWAVPPGFDPHDVLTATIDLAPAHLPPQTVRAFYALLLDRLRHRPEVAGATMVSALPIMGADLEVDLSVTRDSGEKEARDGADLALRHVLVEDRFFSTAGIPLRRGRDFGPADTLAGPPVAILNETAAERLWPGRDALGRQLHLIQTASPVTVVGVVPDALYSDLKEDRRPILYLPYAQAERSYIGGLLAQQMTLLVRAREPLHDLGAVLRAEVQRLNPDVPVFQLATLEERIDATIGTERQAAVVVGALALIAVGLALVGLYAVATLAATERTREFGVRVACGATPRQIGGLVLRRNAWLTLGGLGLGALLGVPGRRFVAGLLFRIQGGDVTTWAMAAATILALALAAAIVPAVRASSIQPMTAMRSE